MKTTTQRLLPVLAVSAGLALSSPSEAYLVDRGHGLVYDTVLDVTWLLDANYAKTSGYHPTGLMTWEEANAWAGSLSYGGHSNWRLPTLTPVNGVAFQYDFAVDGSTDWGYNITSPNSELAYMYPSTCVTAASTRKTVKNRRAGTRCLARVFATA